MPLRAAVAVRRSLTVCPLSRSPQAILRAAAAGQPRKGTIGADTVAVAGTYLGPAAGHLARLPSPKAKSPARRKGRRLRKRRSVRAVGADDDGGGGRALQARRAAGGSAAEEQKGDMQQRRGASVGARDRFSSARRGWKCRCSYSQQIVIRLFFSLPL